MNETSNTNAAPQIVSGGESMDVFEIMQRFRTDGSCEHLIKEALEHLANVRADARAVPADQVHWQLKAGVEQAMCGVDVEGSLTTPLSDKATCNACQAAAWGYQCGRAIPGAVPAAPVAAEGMRRAVVDAIRTERRKYTVDTEGSYPLLVSVLNDVIATVESIEIPATAAEGRLSGPEII